MKREIPIFWGCTLTHNYPFLIESTKKMMEYLGMGASDVKNFGCCPDPIYVKAYGKDVQLSLSARNLSLAEKNLAGKGQISHLSGKDKDNELIVVCNGCFNILNEANKELKHHKLREDINSLLPEDVRYNGEIEVTHILSTLSSQLPVIKTLIKRPLKGLRVAVHYGCHAIYPTAVESDNPKNPTSLDELVRATGAESIDYESKLDCCGIPVIIFDKDEADRMIKNKLTDIKNKVDCVVTLCPACFMRFDMPPAELKELGVPVLHLSELLCLALGVSPSKLFLEGHATKLDLVLEKLGLKQESKTRMKPELKVDLGHEPELKQESAHEPKKPTEIELIERYFEIAELKSHCESCRKECTAAVITADTKNLFDPIDTIDKLLKGKFYEVIEGDDIWRCLQCGKCEEACPTNMGLKDIFSKLRELAIRNGESPKIIRDKIEMLKETGYAMPKRIGIRKRMGIGAAPDIAETGGKEIQEILENIKIKNMQGIKGGEKK